MNIPAFPDMRPLALGDKGIFEQLFKQHPPEMSEFTFTNLFAWKQAYKFCICRLNDCILVVSVKDGQPLDIFDPVGEPSKKKKSILDVFALRGRNARFVRVPEHTAKLFADEAVVRLEEDKNNFDYVYLTRDLAELKGEAFDAKRNFIKRFKENHSFEYKKITKANAGACLSFEEEWCLVKDCQHACGLVAEREAVRQMLWNRDELGIAGGMIEINGKVEAVTLGEELNPDTFVVHVEKANGKHIGIYQAINQIFISNEAGRYTYVNREQDLGVPGLRQAKESYHPHHMVKKYTISLVR
jgi:hypothetical protein